MPLTSYKDRYTSIFVKLRESVLEAAGALPSEARHAIEACAAIQAGCSRGSKDIPQALAGYVQKVALFAYKVTDADIRELKESGYSDAQIFEATTSVAIGVATADLERALQALRGKP